MNSWYQQFSFFMASPFDFYSFSGYEFLLSTIQFFYGKPFRLLFFLRIWILVINNSVFLWQAVSTFILSQDMNSWYQQFSFFMASPFDFYSFSGYEFLISTIQFFYGKPFWLLFFLRIWILDINNSVFLWQALLTFILSQDMNSWYQQFSFFMASPFDFYSFSGYEFLLSTIQFFYGKPFRLLFFLRIWILDINNSVFLWHAILTFILSQDMNSWYQQFSFFMASCFDFYSFSGYEFLISTIQFFYGKPFWLLFFLRIWILDINNSVFLWQAVLTFILSQDMNSWYQQFSFFMASHFDFYSFSGYEFLISTI